MGSGERVDASRRALVRSGVVQALREIGSDQAPGSMPELSDGLRHFLCTRLREDLAALDRRVDTATVVGDRTRAHRDRAATMTATTLADLEGHRPVEQWTVRLLLLGYSRHPEFRHEWVTDAE